MSGRTAVAVSDFFDAEHVRVVTAADLRGLAIAALLVLVSAFGTPARAAGLLVGAAMALSTIVLGALAYRGTDDPSAAQSLYDIAVLATNFAAFPAAVLVAAASRPQVGLPLAGLLLVDAATFAGDGFFSPQGLLLSQIATIAFLAWAAWTSGQLSPIGGRTSPRAPGEPARRVGPGTGWSRTPRTGRT